MEPYVYTGILQSSRFFMDLLSGFFFVVSAAVCSALLWWVTEVHTLLSLSAGLAGSQY